MTEVAELEVRGGVGGLSARLDSVQQAGDLLRTAAATLADQGRAVLAVIADPRLQASAPLSVVTFADAEAALLGAVIGPAGLFAVATRGELLGRAAQAVADGYRTADAVASATLRAAATLTGRAVGVALGSVAPELVLGAGSILTVVVLSHGARGAADPGSDQSGTSAGSRPGLPEPLLRTGEILLRLLADNAGLTEAAVPAVPGMIGGFLTMIPGGSVLADRVFGQVSGPTSVPEVASGLGVIGRLVAVTGSPAWFDDAGPVAVRVVPAPWHRPPTGTADLLARIPVDTDAPMIHVERIDTGSGRRWVVTIPGTARWSPVAGRTPIDLSGDVRLLAGERSAGMTGVVAAMRAIGVRKGEPVLLAGHSQGGLIAAGLAADSSVREEFSITHVLTSGAPVASVSVPEPVQVLSIEHSDDLVPRLDGSVNRDRPNWITVSTPAPTAALSPSDRSEPLLAHRLGLYRSTAERVDRSVNPSIAFWRGGLAAWLPTPQAASGMAGGPQVPGAAWDVEISRVGRT